jgi:urea transporter
MLILFVLSFTVGVIHSTCVNLNNMPALTLAFNILTMAFILSLARHNSTVATLAWQVPSTAGASEETDWGDMSPLFVLDAALRGIGQFCFVGTTLGGGLVLAGITICSRRAGYMALIGEYFLILFCLPHRF